MAAAVLPRCIFVLVMVKLLPIFVVVTDEKRKKKIMSEQLGRNTTGEATPSGWDRLNRGEEAEYNKHQRRIAEKEYQEREAQREQLPLQFSGEATTELEGASLGTDEVQKVYEQYEQGAQKIKIQQLQQLVNGVQHEADAQLLELALRGGNEAAVRAVYGKKSPPKQLENRMKLATGLATLSELRSSQKTSVHLLTRKLIRKYRRSCVEEV